MSIGIIDIVNKTFLIASAIILTMIVSGMVLYQRGYFNVNKIENLVSRVESSTVENPTPTTNVTSSTPSTSPLSIPGGVPSTKPSINVRRSDDD